MTNGQSNREGGITPRDLTEFEFGGLAGKLLREGNSKLANSALMLQDERFGNNPYVSQLLDEFVYDNPKGIKRATEMYSGAHQERLGSASIEVLADYYSTFIDSIGEEYADTIRSELDKFSGEKYGDILKEMAKANYLLEGVKSGLVEIEGNEEKIQTVTETIRKYNSLSLMLGTLNEAKMENLRSKVAQRYHVEELKGIAKNLRETGNGRE